MSSPQSSILSSPQSSPPLDPQSSPQSSILSSPPSSVLSSPLRNSHHLLSSVLNPLLNPQSSISPLLNPLLSSILNPLLSSILNLKCSPQLSILSSPQSSIIFSPHQINDLKPLLLPWPGLGAGCCAIAKCPGRRQLQHAPTPAQWRSARAKKPCGASRPARVGFRILQWSPRELEPTGIRPS